MSALLSLDVNAKVEFEGYYKIEKSGRHTGFALVREEFDPSSKIWTIKYMFQNVEPDHRVQQYRAVLTQDARFKPISAVYEEWGKGIKFRSEMSEFNGKTFKWSSVNGDSKAQKVFPLDKNEFFMSSLNRVLLKNKLKKGMSYSYNAIRENAVQVSYRVRVLDEKTTGGIKFYQVVDENPWHREEFWIAQDSQILFSRLPETDINMMLVANAEEAFGMLNFDRNALKDFFGRLPLGNVNLAANQKTKIPENLFVNTEPKMSEARRPAGDFDQASQNKNTSSLNAGHKN